MTKHLPLHDVFLARNAAFMEFSGWEVPAYFSGIIDEHSAVREKAGFFDISHMGVFSVKGEDAEKFLDYVCTNRIEGMPEGKALYALLCNDAGGIIDDVFVYCRNRTDFFLVVNASNIQKDFEWLEQKKEGFKCALANDSDDLSLFAIQGPNSKKVLKKAFDFDLAELPFHTFCDAVLNGVEAVVSTTGYTGESGCELIFPKAKVFEVWGALSEVADECELKMIGFGARDTLRLEACCHLYGLDMDETTNPFEVGLGWIVKMDKKDFVGKAALESVVSHPARKLVCFEMVERGIPRHGYETFVNGARVGVVTSGSFAPSIKKNVGFALVDKAFSEEGLELDIAIRNKTHKAKIVKRPFYKRKSK